MLIMTMVLKFMLRHRPSDNKRGKRCKGSCKRYYRNPCKSRSAQVAIKRTRLVHYKVYMAQRGDGEGSYSPDSDSFDIGIDTHASFTMSNNRRHFVGPIKPSRSAIVNGVNGSLPIKGVGTVKWTVTDDSGRDHIFRIHGTLYVPGIYSGYTSTGTLSYIESYTNFRLIKIDLSIHCGTGTVP